MFWNSEHFIFWKAKEKDIFWVIHTIPDSIWSSTPDSSISKFLQRKCMNKYIINKLYKYHHVGSCYVFLPTKLSLSQDLWTNEL